MAVAAAAGCTDDGGSAEALCESLAEGDSLTATLAGFDPTHPESALDPLRTAGVQLGELHDAAPDDAAEPLPVEIDYVQALIEALELVEPGDGTEAALQVQAVSDAHPGVDEAAADLAAFADRECTAPAPNG